MIIMVDDNLKNYMFQFIKNVCDEIGPRESGTKQEILAGDVIEKEMQTFCDTTHQEEYISSPHAFLGGIRYGAFLALISIGLYWLSLLIDLTILPLSTFFSFLFIFIALILILITISYFITEVMKYHEFFDFLFPKRHSKNVIGIINPKSSVKNTIIFSAHHDSAFEFNTFYYFKRLGQFIINFGYFGVAVLFVVIVIKLIFQLLSINFDLLFIGFGIFFFIFVPIALAYVFFHSYHPVLGAFDNLSGVAIVLGIGKFLSNNKETDMFPTNTRVHLISFAGEESGLRGSKRYIEAHLNDLKTSDTLVVNMDGIAKKEILGIFTRESGIGANHDPNIYEPLYKLAKEVNSSVDLAKLPFGATDAAAFSKKKISATTIGGLNLSMTLPPYYHTRYDTPEVIEKDALSQVVDICIKYLNYVDKSS
jgi:aminopeptidase YwaD